MLTRDIATSDRCPCCGSPLPSDLVRWNSDARALVGNGNSVFFTAREARVIDALWRHRRSGVRISRGQLIDALYADREDGGAINDVIVSVVIHYMKPRLAAVGLSIDSGRGRPGYRLVVA